MTSAGRWLMVGCAGVMGCAGGRAPAPQPAPQVPAASVATAVVPDVVARCIAASGTHCAAAPVETPARHDSAALAFARGGISLRSSAVDRFAVAHPDWDGRGVLIAILDSGIDPGIPGLMMGTDSTPRILDLRDFSGEGRVALQPAVRRGDTLFVGPRHLLGASHVTALAAGGRIWGGMLWEGGLGQAPAADLNGNGVVGDSLPVIVALTPSGWAVFVDANGDGTVANARPVHDFAVAREFFGWHARAVPSMELLPAPVNIAANISDSAGIPVLDLFFDTYGHGSHVTGIAAGHNMYDVAGFDGVAPGASLIAAKIANDAHGAITVTGSIVRALEYAIRFAHDRAMPLVVNLSFGVGNEVEGTARIDALIDSVLSAHPEVVMTIAVGNDGPGLSTIGFPGSAARGVAVGATLPVAMARMAGDSGPVEPIAPFSSRGGEVAAPDIVVPGAAFSTVPNYAATEEVETGTSMAAPYAAGLAARLLSALHATGRTAPASMVRQALRVSANPAPSGATVDQGAGLPNLMTAWDWISYPRDLPALDVDVGDVHGRGGVLLTTSASMAAHVLAAHVVLRRPDSRASLVVRLRSVASWLHLPETVVLTDGRGEFTASIQPTVLAAPGVLTASIDIEGPDETAGPLAQVPVTVRVTPANTAAPLVTTLTPGPGGIGRVFVSADTGRGLQIQVASLRATDHVAIALHEPGGMPFRDGGTASAGFGDGAGLFDVAANDVVAGVYEADIIAAPSDVTAARVTARMAPLRLGASITRDTLVVTARSLVSAPVPVRMRAGLIGAERTIHLTQSGDVPIRLVVPVPAWAAQLVVDTRMPPDQWSRFTDFGRTFFDRPGRQFAAEPINYAFSRAAPELPDSMAGDSVVILLSPAFADPGDRAAWTMDVTLRYYVAKPYSLDQGGSPMKTVAPASLREEHFAQEPLPIALPPAFVPLITVVALEGEERVWTREVALPGLGAVP